MTFSFVDGTINSNTGCVNFGKAIITPNNYKKLANDATDPNKLPPPVEPVAIGSRFNSQL